MTNIVIRKLDWDEWNIDHIARHEIVPEEVEEVCNTHYIDFRARNNRILMIGETKANRVIKIILEPLNVKNGIWRPVTAHPASRKERKVYQERQVSTKYESKTNNK